MTKDMTKGPILHQLVEFTVPLILGNILQLTYNAVDAMVVGRFVGKEALAAVGTSNPLMTLILLFTNGICIGGGILVSYYFGAKDERKLKRQVSTGMVSGLLFSATVAILVGLFARRVLELLQADPVILPEASSYLRIIMLGLCFSFLYNYLASTLRAMGDSKASLYFLGISAALNICGDLLFVAALSMGVIGAAISTVLCEFASALLCWAYLYRRVPLLRLGRDWRILDFSLLKTTLSYGIVTALQQSTVQMGILAVQAFVNTLGVTATAAFNATNRIDDYAIIPERNIANAMSSFLAQNVGAKKEERVRRGVFAGMMLEIGFSLVVGLLLFRFARTLMMLFTSDEEVIMEGVRFIHLAAIFYPAPAITNGVQGYFRGIGHMRVTLVCSILNMAARVAACYYLLFCRGLGFESIPWSYVAGWACMIAVEVPYLFYTMAKRKAGEDKKQEEEQGLQGKES